jgi:ribosomal protein S18 acetylase RimI-like enzyme
LGVDVSAAAAADLAELTDVAARTFPLACPPSVAPDNIAAFIAANLSQARFRDYLTDADRMVLIARDDGRITGYAMLIQGEPDDDDVQRAVTLLPTVELSKIYVLPDSHGAGAAGALMAAAMAWAGERAAASVWLGVNQKNRRAQRFYAKHGFAIKGTKTFRLGSGVENDYVMVRAL